MKKYLYLALIIGCLVLISCLGGNSKKGGNNSKNSLADISPKPPMGWNSFDAYDCRINETEFKATVDYMAENLLEYGWNHAVIDYNMVAS